MKNTERMYRGSSKNCQKTFEDLKDGRERIEKICRELLKNEIIVALGCTEP